MKKNFVLTSVLLPFLVVAFAGCGKKKSDDVDITIIPEKPIIFTGDFSYPDPTDDTGKTRVTVTGPWCKYILKIKNRADTNVIIAGVEADHTYRKNGVYAEAKSTFSVKTSADSTAPAIFASVDSGLTDTTGTFYDDSLPDADSFNMSVRLKIEGWFGTYEDPKERFSKTVTFMTE